MTAPTRPWARRTPDPRRRRRAGRRLAADGLQRASTTPTCCAPTPSTGCRPRSPSSATRPTARPATCAPGRRHLIGLRLRPRAGGHRQRPDGPLRALAGGDVARGRLPRAAVRRPTPRTRSTGYDDLLRSTAVDAFVVTDTYLGNPPGRLARGAPGAVRGVRPALGRPGGHATRGSTSTAPPAPSWPPTTCSTAATSGSPGSAGARTPGSARTGGPAGPRAMRERGLPTTGLASRVEDTVASGREASARAARRGPADRVRLRLRHPGHGRAAHARRPRPAARPATSRSSASTTPRSPRWCRPGSPRSGSRSRRSRSRWSARSTGLLARPRVVHPPRAAQPDARRSAARA